MPEDKNEKEVLLREHVDSEHSQHSDEPAVSTSTAVRRDETHRDEALSSNQQSSDAVAPRTNLNTPGVLVLQWLTYAFWGWAAVALSWLGIASIGFLVNGSRDQDFSGPPVGSVAYALAAVIVLFLIALVSDIVYARHEPQRKTGMASAIMIIHAVIFALFGIGWLIGAVFGIVRLLIGPESSYSSDSGGTTTLVIMGFTMALIYAASLFRVLRMKLVRVTPYIYWGIMSLVAVVFIGLGIVGPAAYANSTKDDRLIEANLGSVSQAINGYTSANNRLPQSLKDVRGTVNEDTRTLIDRNLVQYKAGKEVSNDSSLDFEPSSSLRIGPSPVKPTKTKKNFEYSLCVTYKTAKNSSGRYSMDSDMKSSNGASYRPTSPDIYSHESGNKCYDLQTSYGSSLY